MKVISVYSLKGGSGKSTIAFLLSQVLIHKGYSVALLDGDIKQKSAINWVQYSDSNIPCYSIDKSLTRKDLQKLNNYDFVIIDGTPSTDDFIKEVLNLSDLVIVPTPPTQLALSSFLQQSHLDLLASLKTQEKPIIAVINGTTPYNQKEVFAMKEIIHKTPVTEILTLGNRKAFIIEYDKPFLTTSNHIAKNEMLYLADSVLDYFNENIIIK